MKNVDNFSETNKSSQVSESFVFKQEENNKLLSETFVFNFEENKSGNDANVTGREFNHDANISGNEKHESLDTKQLETATSTASTTSVTAAVETVATVATTAVIVVVGGGMVIMGQTYEPPSICEFTELYADLNVINFKLNLGNNAEKIVSGEETDECDISIELTCESYSDFKEVKEVKNFGVIEHQFVDLQFETEYTINVIQNSFLDLDSQNIIEPIKITTGSALPVETNEITIEKGTDSFGNIVFYATVSYVDAMSGLSDFSLRVVEGDFDENDLANVKWLEITNLDTDFNGNKKLMNWSSVDASGTYNVVLTANKQESGDGRRRSLKADSTEVVLYRESIDFSKIETTTTNPIKFNLEREVNPLGVMTYYASLSYLGEPSGYEGFDLCFITGGIPEEDDNIDWNGRTYYEVLTHDRTKLEWSVEDDNSTYTVALVGFQEDETGRTKEIIIYNEDIDFSTLSTVDTNETAVYVQRISYTDGTVISYNGCFTYSGENERYYSDFVVYIYNSSEVYAGNIQFTNIGDVFTISMIDGDRLTHYDTYRFIVRCTSTNPVDIEEYAEQHPDSAPGDCVYDFLLLETEIDFSNVPTHYERAPDPDPVVRGCLFYFKNTYYEDHFLFVDFDFTDSNQYWSDFVMTFTDSTSGTTVLSEMIKSDYGKWWLDGFQKEQLEELLAGSWDYEIQCTSIEKGEDNVFTDTIYRDSVDFTNYEFTKMNGCVQIRKERDESVTTSVVYNYFLDLNIENPNDYIAYEVHFTDESTQETFQMTLSGLTNQQITELYNFQATYLVETYGVVDRDGTTEYLFSETINFDSL